MMSKTSSHQSTNPDDKSDNVDGQAEAAAFAARLQARAAELHISRANLMKWLEVRKQTFAGYWNGERVPPAHVLFRMAEELDVSPRWLLEGDEEPGKRNDALSPKIGRQLPYGGSAADRSDLAEVAEIDLRYGMGGTYLEENPELEPRTFSRAWLRNFTDSPPEELFWARGQGNSMEPTISEGAVVLIDRRQNSPRMADLIWAFAFGEVGMIKRLRPMPDGSVKILSDNQAVPLETAHDDELHIIGRVVAVVRKL